MVVETRWLYLLPRPGMGRWLSLKESAHEHAKAMATGLLHQKRCHEKDAGPYCIAGPSGTGRAAEFLTWFLALCYGGYASAVAIETPGGDDDQQWLTFWLMFVGAMFLEETCARVLLSRFPLYYQAKLVFVAWLLFFGGAATVYRRLRMRAARWSPALAGALEDRCQRAARGHLKSMISMGGTLITVRIALFEQTIRKNPKQRGPESSWEYDYTETTQCKASAEETLHQISKWLCSIEGVREMERSLDSDTISSLLQLAASVVSFQPKFVNVHLLGTKPGAEGRLPVMDANGKADCYVKFALISKQARDSSRIPRISHAHWRKSYRNNTKSYWDIMGRTTGGKVVVTSCIAYRTLEPAWNQKLEIPINGNLDESGMCISDIDIKNALLVAEAWDADCGLWGIALEVCRLAGVALVGAVVAAYVLGLIDFLFEGTVTAEQQRWLAALLATTLCLAAASCLSWTMSAVLNADDEFVGNAVVPLAVVADRRKRDLILNLRKGQAARGGLRVKLSLSEK